MIPQELIEKGRYWTKAWSLKDRLNIPLKTRKPQVFAIWSDLFHEAVPDKFIEKAYEVMLDTEKHTYLILTKRPERLYQFYDAHRDALQFSGVLDSIWHGTTVENQEQADKRIPELLKVPGKKFLSVKPMLGEIDITHDLIRVKGMTFKSDEIYAPFSQVICGSESGYNRRLTNIEWVESLAEQCKVATVPIFIKQLTINGKVSRDISEWPINLRRRELVWRV